MKPGTNDSYSTFGFAKLFPAQVQLLKLLVANMRVLDLGCGTLELSKACLKFGASHVDAVDMRNPIEYQSKLQLPPRLQFHEKTFAEFSQATASRAPADLALLSWPINNASINAVIPILRRVPTVLYVGFNDGCTTQCGTEQLWLYLMSREPTQAEFAMNTSLLCYSAKPRQQPYFPEELFGLGATPEEVTEMQRQRKPTPNTRGRSHV